MRYYEPKLTIRRNNLIWFVIIKIQTCKWIIFMGKAQFGPVETWTTLDNQQFAKRCIEKRNLLSTWPIQSQKLVQERNHHALRRQSKSSRLRSICSCPKRKQDMPMPRIKVYQNKPRYLLLRRRTCARHATPLRTAPQRNSPLPGAEAKWRAAPLALAPGAARARGVANARRLGAKAMGISPQRNKARSIYN